MPVGRKLVLDTFCEVYDLLKPYADAEFWDFGTHDPVPNAVYLLGRQQFNSNVSKIRKLVEQDYCKIILSNPAEGSETIKGQAIMSGLNDLIVAKKILIIGGGDMDSSYACLRYDSFLPKILDYSENIQAQEYTEQIYTAGKPYKFLFLNGRYRPHRKFLLDEFDKSRLLDQSIWTALDSKFGRVNYLDPIYEFEFYKDRVNTATTGFVKHELFNGQWGEIYINPRPYVDTYFSLVTETVFDYPYSFRTEKICKPIAMGHPWIAVSNYGYYRDIKNLGFKTYSHAIDESFNLIENNQDRLKRIAQVVTDLAQQDLASFLKECYTVSKYNQSHLVHIREQIRSEFPSRFFQFIKQFNE